MVLPPSVQQEAAIIPPASVAEAREITWTKDELVSLARSEAISHGLNVEKFIDVIDCENDTWDPKRQSELHYKFSAPSRGIVEGTRERSYGLAMIHLPDHPEISLEEATNPRFALKWMASEWQAGRAGQWYCY